MKRLGISFVLLALGVLLAGAGVIGLSFGPALVQYAFLPPTDASGLTAKLEETQKAQAGSFPLLTLHGQKNGVALSTGDTSQNDICLYAVSGSWNEVYPRRYLYGRPVSRMDVEQGNRVIVLDRETAFLFFGDQDPQGHTVSLDGENYEVVGVAEHSRRIGETGKYAAWVPLGTVSGCEIMVLSAPAGTAASVLTQFQAMASEAFGTGTMISLPKEGIRATMILRWAGLILLLWALMLGVRVFIRYTRTEWNRIREESQRRYAGRLLPYAILHLIPAALFAGALIAVGAGLAILAVNPAQIFPDWVPESLGDFSAWGTRFWNLTAESAKSVTFKTPELAELRFWAAFVRWGTVLILLCPWKRPFSKAAGRIRENL